MKVNPVFLDMCFCASGHLADGRNRLWPFLLETKAKINKNQAWSELLGFNTDESELLSNWISCVTFHKGGYVFCWTCQQLLLKGMKGILTGCQCLKLWLFRSKNEIMGFSLKWRSNLWILWLFTECSLAAFCVVMCYCLFPSDDQLTLALSRRGRYDSARL